MRQRRKPVSRSSRLHRRELRAAELVVAGRWREALSELAQLVLAQPPAHPRRAIALATLAHVYSELGRPARAEHCARCALELEPTLREARLVLARVERAYPKAR